VIGYFDTSALVPLVVDEPSSASAAAAEASRRAAQDLATKGLSVRDIGALLGTSYQRAQKLAVAKN